MDHEKLIRQAALGAFAGVAGALAMQAFRSVWRRLTCDRTEDGIFGFDREADVNSMQKLSKAVLGRALAQPDTEKLALAFHYGYGATAGALYAVASERAPVIRVGFGTVFGGLLWLAGDEFPITVSGVSNPCDKTVASHASALAVHLLFGSVVEGMSRYLLSSRRLAEHVGIGEAVANAPAGSE